MNTLSSLRIVLLNRKYLWMSVRNCIILIIKSGTISLLVLLSFPRCIFRFHLCTLGFWGIWLSVCFRNKKSVHRIHMLMAALVVMKALNLIFTAEDKHYVKVIGIAHGWDVLFYIFQSLRVVLLFTVIALIGTGWSFLKPFLQEREKKVLMILIPLQVLANVASIVIGETGPFIRDWVTWNQVFFVVDIVCCCAIIFLIVWSIRSLMGRLQGIYFAFYIMMFYMFRPVEKNEYFVLGKEDRQQVQCGDS